MIISIVISLTFTALVCKCLKDFGASKTRIGVTAAVSIIYAALLLLNAPAIVLVAAYATLCVVAFRNFEYFMKSAPTRTRASEPTVETAVAAS